MAGTAIYLPSQTGPLRQGEIISGLVQIRLHLEAQFPVENDPIEAERINHPFVVILSQDCDLDWDFKDREGTAPAPHKELPSTLLCEAFTADELRQRDRGAKVVDMNRESWNLVKMNKHERYHFLQKVTSEQDALGEGLPEFAIDFKHYFTLPTDELYAQIEVHAKRRCRMDSPYAEHLSDRFFNFQARIALPADHESEPTVN